jgi:hypothetical protein
MDGRVAGRRPDRGNDEEVEMSKLRPSNRTLALAALAVSVAAFVMSSIAAATATTRVIIRKGDIAPGAVTAKTLAKGAVTAKKLAKGAVTSPKIQDDAITASKIGEASVHSVNLASESVDQRILKKESVGTTALANDAVTAVQIAPGSVYAGALQKLSVQTKPIVDLDQIAHNLEWTESNAETVFCKPGEKLIGPAFGFTESGNHQVTWLQVMPYLNGPNQGVTGRIATDAGGAAKAEIGALCLE